MDIQLTDKDLNTVSKIGIISIILVIFIIVGIILLIYYLVKRNRTKINHREQFNDTEEKLIFY